MMLHQEKELPNDSGRPLNYNNFTDKKQNGCFYKKQCFLRFMYCVESQGFEIRGSTGAPLPEKDQGVRKENHHERKKILLRNKVEMI